MTTDPTNYFLTPGYQHRWPVDHFDDTVFRDEFQAKVYEEAQYWLIKHKLTTVLDVGCGSGYKLLKYFGGYNTKAVGVEVEPTLSWLRQAYPHKEWLGAVEGQHDLVICSDVIEHVEDPYAMLDAIATTGFQYLVISTPAVNLLGHGTEMGPPRNIHHVREWTEEGFKALIGTRFNVIRQVVFDGATQVIVATPK